LSGQRLDVAIAGLGLSMQFVDQAFSNIGRKLAKLSDRTDRVADSLHDLYSNLQ
jgi:hypothetical protein